MSNLGSYVKAKRKAPTHLTEELKNWKLVLKTIEGMNAEEMAVLVKGLHNLYDFLHEAVLANQEGN